MPRLQRGAQRASDAQADLLREAFAQSVIRGLGDRPRWLSCRYLYDREGSEIFERITEQPEYYPTRTEAGILCANARTIRDLCGSGTLVELGAGSATKTRHLLRAWTEGGRAASYVAVDISRSMLAETCSALGREFPSLAVRSLAGSYEQALPLLRECSPLTLLFLGSSVGNFNEEELGEFLTLLSANLACGDHLLLGIDLVKDTSTLEAAYNDAAGWSEAFTLNLFERMNRELDTDLDVDAIEHVARWNAERSRIDIHARFLRSMVVSMPEWKREFRIAEGESVLVEISTKFECDAMVAVAGDHGLDHVATFADADRRFALLLLRRRADAESRAESTRVRLRRELDEQRARTLEIVAPLDDEQMSRQHCTILSPVVWDLGHIASFEREWTARASGVAPDSADAKLYDPLLQPRAVRGSLALAGPRTCEHVLEEVRASTLALLDRSTFPADEALLRDGYVFSNLVQHEAQHSETILQGIQLLPGLRYQPARRIGSADPRAVDVAADKRVDSTACRSTETAANSAGAVPPGCAHDGAAEAFVAAGPFTMGTDDKTVAYDNERPAHVVELASFWIDVTPVTNAVYLAFVDDGGYRRRELWTRDGWRWLVGTKAEYPAEWRRTDDGEWQEHAFGRVEPLAGERPVAHVSWYEAAACACWLGKRLPTEHEWEKAASWDLERGVARFYPWGDGAPDDARANLDQRTFAPTAVGSYPRGRSYFGCEQMLGDVWEWTASDFLRYPGFRAFPYAEYSQIHFGNRYKVLRGGSWATPSVAIRNTFRNWDLPQRRQLFAGFRCARD